MSNKTLRKLCQAIETLEPRRMLAAGDLDLSFGGDGVVRLPEMSVREILPLANGQYMIGASSGSAPHPDGAWVMRVNSDGSHDPSFGTTGTDQWGDAPRARVPSPYDEPGPSNPEGMYFVDMALAPDGKIVILGTGNNDWGLARFNSNGTLDSTFGGNGLVRYDLGGSDDQPRAVIVQSDGKIVAAGSPIGRSFTLVRFNTNGTVDTSFDGDGRAVYHLPSYGTLTHMELAPGNKVIAGGMTRPNPSTPHTRTFVRFNLSNGSLDNTLDGDGVLKTSGTEELRDMLVMSDGRILMLAHNPSDVLVNRYLSTGATDGTFGTGGQAAIDAPNLVSFRLATQSNGKIIISGAFAGEDNQHAQLLRLNANGTLDTTFGTNGRVDHSSNILGSGSRVEIAVTPDQKLLATPHAAYLGRYLLDGAPNGGEGTDKNIFLSSGVLNVQGTSADDVIHIVRTFRGAIGVILNDTFKQFSPSAITSIFIDGEDGHDSVSFGESISIPASIRGAAGNDAIAGGDGNDTLDGGAGTDTLDGGNGTDTGLNTAGDTLTSIENPDGGGGGSAQVIAGVLTVDGTSGNDTIVLIGSGGPVSVSINGTSFGSFNSHDFTSILIRGQAGNDNISATDYAERIEGGAGSDSIQGNGGNDTIDGGSGGDTMKGGAGNDTADYSSRTANLTIGLGTLSDDGESGEKDNVFFDIETVIGGSGNDNINGSDANNLLVGNGGNDSLRGNFGNDTLSGDAGTDTLNGEGGSDTAVNHTGDTLIGIENPGGGGGNGTVTLSGRSVVVTGTEGNDIVTIRDDAGAFIPATFFILNGVTHTIEQEDFDNILINVLGGDDQVGVSVTEFVEDVQTTINAGDGNDLVRFLESGPFTINGGNGNDSVAGESGDALFHGGAGIDEIEMEQHQIQTVIDLTLMPTTENARAFNNGGAGSLIIGNDLDNVLEAAQPATIRGHGGNDTITTSGDDTDTINVLEGGSGNDTLVQIGNARSSLLGEVGDDSLQGGSGSDTLDGGSGADTMKGGADNDSVYYFDRTANLTIGLGTLADDGEAGEKDNVWFDIETVYGGSGNDTISGYSGNELLIGNEGNDSIRGNYGDDTLSGDAGTDTLNGEAGNDSGINTVSDTLISIENIPDGGGNAYVQNGMLFLDGTEGPDSVGISGVPGQQGISLNGQAVTLGGWMGIMIRTFGGDDDVDLDEWGGGDVTIQAGGGEDFINLEESDAHVDAGLGNDIVRSIDGRLLTFNDPGGIDEYQVHGQFADFSVDMVAFAGLDHVTGNGNVGSVFGNDLPNRIDLRGSTWETTEILGRGGDDTLFGSTAADSIDGGAGNDYLNDGGGSFDTLKGGTGNDTVDYSSRTNNLIIGLGTLADDGEAGENDNVWLDIETVLGGIGNDSIKGHAGNELLVGNGGNDTLRGNYGDDTLVGNGGSDVLDGENGNDTATNSAGDILISIENS